MITISRCPQTKDWIIRISFSYIAKKCEPDDDGIAHLIDDNEFMGMIEDAVFMKLGIKKTGKTRPSLKSPLTYDKV